MCQGLRYLDILDVETYGATRRLVGVMLKNDHRLAVHCLKSEDLLLSVSTGS